MRIVSLFVIFFPDFGFCLRKLVEGKNDDENGLRGVQE
jgi:hypothetical protein